MITININGLTLCHKGSDGISHNTLPDVCKTPGKGTPVPYENEAYSADLIKGTASVFADGGNIIANMGSQFARSVFDEPGSMGGIKSGTNKAETDWISHSFDVFFEGKPACRLTDKLFMNHRNTMNMAGLKQAALADSHDNKSQSEDNVQTEISLTIGVFFDGTGNNAINVEKMISACDRTNFNINNQDAKSILTEYTMDNMGFSSLESGSHTCYYTNIHWLYVLYRQFFESKTNNTQDSIYIEGIGTENGKPDNLIGLGLGEGDTGVLAKADEAVSLITKTIKKNLEGVKRVKSLQFDIFGFSRGAAAARHFANRIYHRDPAMIKAISQGMAGRQYDGTPTGNVRFIGIFDTVAAIGTPLNGMNPHSANTGGVDLMLHSGIADKVFHIVAQHECRFNFALNSVKPAWPELVLPGVHSDIGGGYWPQEVENYFLTRPQAETVPLSQPDRDSPVHQKMYAELRQMSTSPAIAPILRTNDVTPRIWDRDNVPPDSKGNPQKRTYVAMTMLERPVKNSWSTVALEVMLDAATEAGCLFYPTDDSRILMLPDELQPLNKKALAMGKAVRGGQNAVGFSSDELDILAKEYIHCSANWNNVEIDNKKNISSGTQPLELIFANRPDEQWLRTIYDMNGIQRYI